MTWRGWVLQHALDRSFSWSGSGSQPIGYGVTWEEASSARGSATTADLVVAADAVTILAQPLKLGIGSWRLP